MNKTSLLAGGFYFAVLIFSCLSISLVWIGNQSNGFSLWQVMDAANGNRYYPSVISTVCVNPSPECTILKKLYSAGNAAIFFLFVSIFSSAAASTLLITSLSFHIYLSKKNKKYFKILSSKSPQNKKKGA